MKALLFTLLLLTPHFAGAAEKAAYSPRGVGGGGALAGFSISPYGGLRFVGTDMGTLFRSTDEGKTWAPVNQAQVKYNSDLSLASDVGFSADPSVVFFADAGREPKRSKDGGISWHSIPIPLSEKERILYWSSDSKNSKFILAATTEGLIRSSDGGEKWTRLKSIQGSARGTFFLHSGSSLRIFHATENGIFTSDDRTESFQKWYTPNHSQIRAFTGGIDQKGSTLAFSDDNGKTACAWANKAGDSSAEQKKSTQSDCGSIWILKNPSQKTDFEPQFATTQKEAGRFLRMAENDSQTLYVTGGEWVRQYGSKVWVSRDAGTTFNLVMQVYDWDQHPYQPWPKTKLEYSSVGLDIGWDDNAPVSFAVNARKSSEAGGTGYYFLHTTEDYGNHWKAPFTQFSDSGERTKGKRWKSSGLEVSSDLRFKFHPKESKLAYVSVADLGGLVTEDGGETFRISKAKYNTNYDYAFDPSKKDRVFAASGARHDFPLNINTPLHGEGGIFLSDDRGRHWKRLTPENEAFNRQFLSLAYDPLHHTLYGGTQGGGVARSSDDGKHWEFLNAGFPAGDQVVPQLEIDPHDGTAYALLTGNAPDFQNKESTGIYRLSGSEWKLLRGTVKRPKEVEAQYPLWQFPSSFAVDFSSQGSSTLWLTDIENKGAWLATGAWKSTDSGQTWTRMTQFTHPTAISIDPKSPQTVHVSGLYDVSGKWGKGGALYTEDGGATWKKNEKLPLQANLFSFTPDPKSPANGFYLFFGGGMFYGPAK